MDQKAIQERVAVTDQVEAKLPPTARGKQELAIFSYPKTKMPDIEDKLNGMPVCVVQ